MLDIVFLLGKTRMAHVVCRRHLAVAIHSLNCQSTDLDIPMYVNMVFVRLTFSTPTDFA